MTHDDWIFKAGSFIKVKFLFDCSFFRFSTALFYFVHSKDFTLFS